MAVTWDVKITVLDVSKKAVSVTATRTDDAKPEKPKVYSVLYAVIDTTEQKIAVMDNIWAQHQSSINRDAQISAFVGNLELQANANLEARE